MAGQLSWLEHSVHTRSVEGSNPPPATINIAEIYPSLAEGTGLENQQRINVLRGFESLNLRHLLKNLISRDGAVWQLVGLITRRSLVQILLPQPKWSGSSAGQNAALSRRRSRVRVPSRPPNDGSVAQSVEQRTENPRVGGSIPPGTTIFCL